jgi:VWFA-related protein
VRFCSSFSPRNSSSALAALLLCGALVLTVPGHGQTPQKQELDFTAATGEDTSAPKQSDFVERARVQLALIEAVVLDKKGRHVRGLPPGAFTLKIAGREVQVLTVDEIDLSLSAGRAAEAASGQPAAVPGEAAAEPTVEPETPPAAGSAPSGESARTDSARQEVEARQSGPRWFAMVFDGYNNIAPRRMNQGRIAAKKWLDKNLREEDMVAVFEITPFLHSVIGFTNDIPAVKDAIDDVRVFPGSSMGEELMEQKLDPNNAATRDYMEQQLRNAATFSADLLQAERDQFYENMRNVAEAMSDLRGSKALVLFSGGFPLTMSKTTTSTGGFTPRFVNMLRQLEAFGVRVFSFDIGEEGGFTDADQATNYRLQMDQLNMGSEWLDDMQIGMRSDALSAHREILSVLGTETGGRFWRNRDYAAGLQATDDDLSHYYLVGFRPASSGLSRRDYQRLKLSASLDGKDLKVIARRGRFKSQQDEEMNRRLAEARAAEAQRAEAEERAGDIPAAVKTVPVLCRPTFHPSADGQTLVVLPVQVGGPIDTVSIGSGQRVLDFTVTVSATLDGNEVAGGTRDVRMQIPDEAARHLAAGFQVREAVLLPPVALDLEISITLNGQDRSGTWRSQVRVPGRENDAFGLTDLTLLHPAEKTPLVYDVFIKGDAVFGTQPAEVLEDPLGGEVQGRPPMYLRGAFSRGVPLIAQVRVTAPPHPSAEQQSPLGMDWELLPAEGGDALAPPVRYRRLQLIQDGEFLDVMVDLDLSQVEPGDYTLRLTARNLVEAGEDVRSYPITVAP